MKTRFDCPQNWIKGNGEVIPIKDMETSHLINTVRMFVRKPFMVCSMIIEDIENKTYSPVATAWNPNGSEEQNIKNESIFNVTSLTEQELTAYALQSALGCAMVNELSSRGVNTENIITMTMNENSN